MTADDARTLRAHGFDVVREGRDYTVACRSCPRAWRLVSKGGTFRKPVGAPMLKLLDHAFMHQARDARY